MRRKFVQIPILLLGIIIGLSISLLIDSAQAGLISRFKKWQKEEFETAAFENAKDNIIRAFDAFPKEKISYDFNLPKPTTVALNSKELNEIYKTREPDSPIERIAGFYDYKTKTVYYEKDQYSTLVHEYTHYFNWNNKDQSQVDSRVKVRMVYSTHIDELAAHLAGDLADLEEQLSGMKRRLTNCQHEKNRMRR